ncbi:MAG: hypothetical protein ACP5G2_00355 [Candidatus Bipolaricaulaceae bacterium]
MKRWGAVAAAALVLAPAVAGEVPPAELGRQLADLVYSLAPLEVFRRQAAGALLAGSAPPSLTGALDGLSQLEDQLALLLEELADDQQWPETRRTLGSALGRAGETRGLLRAAELAGWGELPPAEQEALLTAVGEVRNAILEEAMPAAQGEARTQDAEWQMAAAFLAQTVLLSPPSYLRIDAGWEETFSQLPAPEAAPPAARHALGELLAFAGHTLSGEEAQAVQRIAEEMLSALLPEPKQGGGGG